MKKSLDDHFKAHLKDQCTIPEDIVFNQELVQQRIMKEVAIHQPHRSWRMAAMLLIIIGLSSICLYQQSRIEKYKRMGAVSLDQKILREALPEKANPSPETNAIVVDTKPSVVREHVVLMHYMPRIEALVSPTTQINPIAVSNAPADIEKKEIAQSAMNMEDELELPTFFESEELALSTKETDQRRTLLKRLEKLVNN